MKLAARMFLTKRSNKIFTERTLSNKIQIFANGRGSRAFGIFVFLRKSGYFNNQIRSTTRGKIFACVSNLAEKHLCQIQQIPINSMLTNEPFKNNSYMETSEKTKNIIAAVSKGQKLPPIKVITHPYDSSKNIVVDGNHRMYAFRKLNIQQVHVIKIPYKNVILMKSLRGEPKVPLGSLDKFLKDKNIIDSYFVQPNGENRFL